MNEKEVFKKVKKIQQRYKDHTAKTTVLFWVTGIAICWFAGKFFFGEGFNLFLFTVATLGVGCLILCERKTRSIQKEARGYAAEQLLFPTMQEKFQIYEFKPKEVIEKYMAEKSELLPVTKKYDGYGYIRASYRGAMFRCSNVSIKKTKSDDNDNWRYEKNRYKKNLGRNDVIYEGMLARVDLNTQVDGFLKIEEFNSVRGPLHTLTFSLQEKLAKVAGVQLYDFSTVNLEFHNRFKVTASNEWFVQQILTPAVMNGLLQAKTYTDGRISLHFTQDDLFISNKHEHVLMAIEEGKYSQDYLLEDAQHAQGDVLALANILDVLTEHASFAFFG